MSTASSKSVSTLVKFTWGDPLDPTTLLLTDANEIKTTSKGKFTPDTKLRVDPVLHFGTLDEPDRKIDFSDQTHNFPEELTSGVAFPPIKCDVWEYHEQEDGVIFYSVFRRANVIRALKNPKGRESIYQVILSGEKRNLDEQRAGIPCLELCDNTFGDGDTCKVDLIPITEPGTIISVVKQVVTITGLSTQGNGYWVPGSVVVDGLTIKIIAWDGSESFTLARLPRESWSSASCQVIPGCDNSLPVCTGRWKNTKDWTGAGLVMPEHHPIMENPRGT